MPAIAGIVVYIDSKFAIIRQTVLGERVMLIRLIQLFIAILALCMALNANAVPGSLSYQGYLTDPSGSPINGAVSVTFTLHDADIAGSSQWTETQNVDISQGLFQVELGADGLNPFSAGLFDLPLWLGMAVELDSEMPPRTPLTSVGFAFKAEDAETVGGNTALDLDQSAHVTDTGNPHSVSAAQTGAASTGNVGSGVKGSDTFLDAFGYPRPIILWMFG